MYSNNIELRNNYISDVSISYSVTDKFIFILYSLFFILKPFYFWNSGLPQIADIIMVSLIFCYSLMVNFRYPVVTSTKRALFVCLIFVSYLTIVNLSWMTILQTYNSFYLPSIFFIYNFIVFFIVISMYEKYEKKLLEVTYKAILISILLQFFLFIINGGYTGGRLTGNFNNPNQLGYYCLLVASLLVYIGGKIKVKIIWFSLGLMASVILVFASLSKAAILSMMGLIVVFLINRTSNKKLKRRLWLIFLVVAIGFVCINTTTTIVSDNALVKSVKKRLESIGMDNDDSLEGRGYNRIFDYPEYWIFGAGEGEYTRFEGFQLEMHSTLGNIQASYGLIGLCLFLCFLFLTIRKDLSGSWYIILFIMTYGLTHNGIRNSLFWILIALIAVHLKSTGKSGLSNSIKVSS